MALDAMSDHELRQRFEMLKGVEHHKNDLILELLSRVDKLEEAYQQMALDHQRETQFNREGQLRERKLQDELRKMKSFMNRDPFVLVLIDGDGMIFDDKFIRKGEIGGKEAAAELWNGIKDHIHDRLPDIPSDCRIVTRIYANLKGLSDICWKAGLLEKPSLVEEFYRGFTGSKILFDFIDVGPGKDRADEKITELFKLHLTNFHCQHMFFGCSHDNGYARLLEQYTEPMITDRITLLEGVPFEKELYAMKAKYSTVKFENIFRSDKINVYNQTTYPVSQSFPYHPMQISSGDTTSPPALSGYQSPYQPIIGASTPSPAPSNPSTMNPKAPSWASAATSAIQIVSPPATPTPTPSNLASSTDIPRNRYGQRIDPPNVYDKEEVDRVRKLKLCNVHFLRGDCGYDPCTHSHSKKLSKAEMAALKTVARMKFVLLLAVSLTCIRAAAAANFDPALANSRNNITCVGKGYDLELLIIGDFNPNTLTMQQLCAKPQYGGGLPDQHVGGWCERWISVPPPVMSPQNMAFDISPAARVNQILANPRVFLACTYRCFCNSGLPPNAVQPRAHPIHRYEQESQGE
ncbi:MAG: hypothetical protein Q9166_003473 [cf. Caloplaca sp. 2 TL-2023]